MWFFYKTTNCNDLILYLIHLISTWKNKYFYRNPNYIYMMVKYRRKKDCNFLLNDLLYQFQSDMKVSTGKIMFLQWKTQCLLIITRPLLWISADFAENILLDIGRTNNDPLLVYLTQAVNGLNFPLKYFRFLGQLTSW